MYQFPNGNWRAKAPSASQYSSVAVRHRPYEMRRPKQSGATVESSYGSKSLKIVEFMGRDNVGGEALPAELEALALPPFHRDAWLGGGSQPPAAPPTPGLPPLLASPPAKSICTPVFIEAPEVRAPPPTPRYRSLACSCLGYANVFDAAIATAEQRMLQGNLNTARRSMEQRANAQANPFQLEQARGLQHQFNGASITSLARQRWRTQLPLTDRDLAKRRKCPNSAVTALGNSNSAYRPRMPVAPMQFPLATARDAIGMNNTLRPCDTTLKN